MKAIAVLPGKPGSVHLAEPAKPSVSDVPNGRGVLVKVLRVGDGTDREINAADYSAAQYRKLFDRLQNPNGAIKIFCELG